MTTLAALTLTYLLNGSPETIQLEVASEQACIATANEKVLALHQQGAQVAWTCETKSIYKTTAYHSSTKPTKLALVTQIPISH